MRFWPFAASRQVIEFTLKLVPVVVLTACGGGTGSEDPDAGLQAGAQIPTSSLTDADVLPSGMQSFNVSTAQQTAGAGASAGLSSSSGTTDSVDESLQLGLARPVNRTQALAPSPPPTDTADVALTETGPEPDVTTAQSPVPVAGITDAPEPHTEPVDTTIPTESDSSVSAAEPENPVAPTTDANTTVPEEPVSPQPDVAVQPSAPPEPVTPTQGSTPEEPASALPVKSFNIGSKVGDVTKLLSNLPASASQTNVQQTPIAVADGYLYTANIEHGPRGDVRGYDLKTVIRQGTQNDNGVWSWQQTVVEDRTIHDKWHTAPSIEVDKQGLIHVVYNLHNFPWQYKRSTQPHDLNTFEFRGQYVTDEEIRISAEENKTTFPTLGKADIPGNQVTYPAFFKDRNDDLYLSYRFGATPKQSFSNRTMSSGVSVYNSVTQTWQALGGQLPLTSADYQQHPDAPNESIAIAAKRGWTNYHPRLVFDNNNKLFISWFWRSGTAGAMLTKPCLIYSSDRSSFFDSSNNGVSLPMEPDQCGNLGYGDNQKFYSVGNTAINNNGEVHVVLSPDDTSRKIVYFDKASGEWRRENSPYNATEIFFDADDTLWAIASNIRIYKRPKGSSTWQTVYEDTSGDNCYPRVTLTEDQSFAFIHAEACDYGAVTVYGLRLK